MIRLMEYTTIDALMESKDRIENALSNWKEGHPEYNYNIQTIFGRTSYRLEVTVYATESNKRFN